MSNPSLWRYLSLAKYIDLLRTRSLYFPKASLFQDETEGKWWGHAHLYQNAEKWRQSPANIKTLEEMLERAGQDQSAILREINSLIPSANDWVRNILLTAKRVYPYERRAHIEDTISSWKRQYNDHDKSVEQWKKDIAIFRESTYISCWNRASYMSLAMWEMYGGGRDSVAVQSTKSKLESLIVTNLPFLQEQGLEAGLADVEYIDRLKNPDEGVQDRVYEIIFERDRDFRIGVFAIKPSVYEFEQEVRAILYPKRDLLDPIEDPHPDVAGFSLPIGCREPPGEWSIADLIEKVYVHPMLGEGSIMVQNVKEINRLFHVEGIPVIADKIEAMGTDIALPVAAKSD